MKYNAATDTFEEIAPDDAVTMRRLALAILQGETPTLPDWADDYVERQGPRSHRLLVIVASLAPKILATLVQMHSEEWTRFHAGSWQLRGVETLPKPGRYDTCTAGGEPCLTPIVVYKHPNDQTIKSTHPWGGYIWNQPLPEPKPPEES
jgi:hypothetical protein